MRYIEISIQGDDWDDEDEADALENDVIDALDSADFDYLDVRVKQIDS